jgi:hypothetical protein
MRPRVWRFRRSAWCIGPQPISPKRSRGSLVALRRKRCSRKHSVAAGHRAAILWGRAHTTSGQPGHGVVGPGWRQLGVSNALSSLERSCEFTFASSNFCWFDFEKLPMLRRLLIFSATAGSGVLCGRGEATTRGKATKEPGSPPLRVEPAC